MPHAFSEDQLNTNLCCISTHRKGAEVLDPALKSWLDNVVIPALVKVYLEQQKAIDMENGLANQDVPPYAQHDSEPIC